MQDTKEYYLQEFCLFDGESDLTFNIIDLNTDKMVITLAVSHLGKISVIESDLLRDKENNLYFNYGVDKTPIKVEDFEKLDN